MSDFEKKVVQFAVALCDVYANDDQGDEDLTEDFTAMVYAQWVVYQRMTDDDVDIFGFTHLCNRLVLQQMFNDHGINI